jgi:SAM-dependent methyltransferase
VNWKYKAGIMKLVTFVPFHEKIYKLGQKLFGRLYADPAQRISLHIEIVQLLKKNGKEIEGKIFFEVGSGHELIVPLCYYLNGAAQVITVDLNLRLDVDIFKKSLAWFVENRDSVLSMYADLANESIFNERMNVIDKLKDDPIKLLSEANIKYLAPTDASNTKLEDSVIDYHISTVVFEHIPKDILSSIMKEARRILKKNGTAVHLIDLSDHFEHQDTTISEINFLKYSEKAWKYIAGNQFAYTNRLRRSDFVKIFTSQGFDIVEEISVIDQNSKKLLSNGFLVHEDYKKFSVDDLCTTKLTLVTSNNK